jgi:hypothetical protein
MAERPGVQRNSAETLFQTYGPSWGETDLGANPVALVKDLLRPDRRKELQDKIRGGPVSVAVGVSTVGESSPTNPHGFMNQHPSMAVFGDSSWVSNQGMREGTGHFELFVSTLSWLRERPDIGNQAEPKERRTFTLNTTPEVISRVVWLPPLFITLGILGLGGGIWLVRRR